MNAVSFLTKYKDNYYHILLCEGKQALHYFNHFLHEGKSKRLAVHISQLLMNSQDRISLSNYNN